jgi:hypothetical protein
MPFDGFVEDTQVMDRLKIGRARIEAGWCQGQMHRARFVAWNSKRRHEYCLVGAVRLDHPDVVDLQAAARTEHLIAAAMIELGHSWNQLADFNDFPGRTKAEVLEVVDLAIAMSRGEYRPRGFATSFVAHNFLRVA